MVLGELTRGTHATSTIQSIIRVLRVEWNPAHLKRSTWKSTVWYHNYKQSGTRTSHLTNKTERKLFRHHRTLHWKLRRESGLTKIMSQLMTWCNTFAVTHHPMPPSLQQLLVCILQSRLAGTSNYQLLQLRESWVVTFERTRRIALCYAINIFIKAKLTVRKQS